ncbi:MAG TPA: DUF2878 domain-containing protein [Gammaproteobacteria bacterium]|nr:DUF2878 domain-containing protein [Gammaproteobacteria bacterium]
MSVRPILVSTLPNFAPSKSYSGFREKEIGVEMKHVFVNLAVFKVAWTAVVVSAAAGAPVIGVIAVAIAVGIHLWSNENPDNEIRLLFIAATMGFAWESVLVLASLLEYSSGNWVSGLAPYWIVSMWVLFATTLNVGMRWLRRSTAIAAVAGAIGGPLAFFAGASIGAVELVSPAIALIAIGFGWAVMLPLLVKLAVWLEDGHRLVEQSA